MKNIYLHHVVDTGIARLIKQRHLSISPAIEKMIYEELDRMLRLI